MLGNQREYMNYGSYDSYDSHINDSEYINEIYAYWWSMIVKDYCIGNINDNDSYINDNYTWWLFLYQ